MNELFAIIINTFRTMRGVVRQEVQIPLRRHRLRSNFGPIR